MGQILLLVCDRRVVRLLAYKIGLCCVCTMDDFAMPPCSKRMCTAVAHIQVKFWPIPGMGIDGQGAAEFARQQVGMSRIAGKFLWNRHPTRVMAVQGVGTYTEH